MTNELETVKSIAAQAGEILLEHFARKVSVRWKGVGNPVTDADQSASRFIVGELRRIFPSDGILCEEELDDRGRLGRSRVWIVDPMDGTSEFVAGRGEFTVMIGLAEEGRPVLGVVYLPIEKKFFHAEHAGGAFIEAGSVKRKLSVSSENDLSKATLAASRSHDSAESQRIREILDVRAVVHAGGVGLKVGMLCEGLADLYLHAGPGTNEWDTCAPEVILHEAHGRMTDLHGQPLRYNRENPANLSGIIASNGHLHDAVVQASRSVTGQ